MAEDGCSDNDPSVLRSSRLKTTMDGLHAGLEAPKPGAQSVGGPDHAHGNCSSRMILMNVVECCGNYGQEAPKLLILWRPRRRILNHIARARAAMLA
jgi:hypothetical protein